ncbi:MAG: hypothetical protein Kow0059_19910 [Candidatus Sumerlaeia bacterium]
MATSAVFDILRSTAAGMLKRPGIVRERSGILAVLVILPVAAGLWGAPGYAPCAEFRTLATSEHFLLQVPADRPQALSEERARAILQNAENAAGGVRRQLPLPLGRPITLVYCPDAALFARLTAGQSESTLAAARGKLGLVYLNGEALRAEDPVALEGALRHEYAHVYLAQTIPGDMPRWMDEGLAMHVTGEWDLWDSLVLRKAHALDRLLPLASLARDFPSVPDARRLAYLQSYSVVAYLIATQAEGARTARGFIRSLQQRPAGQPPAEEYFRSFLAASVEAGWRHWLGGRWISALAVVGSSGFFWFAVSLLCVAAWWVKRRAAARRRAEWEADEEHVYSVLDEVEGPPGDPEDYLPEPTPYEEYYESDED